MWAVSIKALFVICVFVCGDRDLGGEAMLRETIRGALSAQRERYCLSYRGLCHHAAGVWHAGGGKTPPCDEKTSQLLLHSLTFRLQFCPVTLRPSMCQKHSLLTVFRQRCIITAQVAHADA